MQTARQLRPLASAPGLLVLAPSLRAAQCQPGQWRRRPLLLAQPVSHRSSQSRPSLRHLHLTAQPNLARQGQRAMLLREDFGPVSSANDRTTCDPAPADLTTGSGSPVRVASSTEDRPLFTVPSTGRRSPGSTASKSPGDTASAGTSRQLPSARTKRATEGSRPCVHC